MEKIPVVQEHTPSQNHDGKFHVKLVEGRFQNIRRAISWPLIALFFITVWLEFDGQPAVLFSFAERKIILFGSALSWHDLPLLAGLMIAGVSLLFFMAVAWGRVWCGFACPQSIWTWLFIRIEQLTEGRVNQRAKLDQQLLNWQNLLRRISKHTLWLLLSLMTAITFSGYFIPIQELTHDLLSLQLSITTAGWITIMALLTYLNAGLVREKICLHACPYSRFQGVMFDQDTVTVSYDQARGEPRTKRREINFDSGDCVDCDLCVQVCPTGIDIRQGLQAGCIDCGACIDACDQVMHKVGRESSLIRFVSEKSLNKRPSQLLRPRLLGYGLVMVLAFSAVLFGFTNTTKLLIEIRRDRTSLFTQLDQNTICNNYMVKVEQFDNSNSSVDVSLSARHELQLFGNTTINLRENNASWLPYRVCSSDNLPKRSSLAFVFESETGKKMKITTFITQTI